MRILIVENEHVIASHVTRLLLTWGHDIIYYGHDGHQLLAEVDHHPPDLILTGLFLKGPIQGLELIERLRTRWHIPVVILSGATVSDLPSGWQDKPVTFFLAKPFLPHQLRAVIARSTTRPDR
ncbi:MAG: response regulator [Bacteroidota bacterium]